MNSPTWITITLAILLKGDYRASGACTENDIGDLEGFWGNNVTIVCRSECPSIYWYFKEEPLSLRSCDTYDRLCKTNDSDMHILHIVNTSDLDKGVYECKCYENRYFKEYVACYNLRISCQAQIQINGEPSQLYNSTAATFTTHSLNVTINNRVKLNCFQGATEGTNCNGVKRARRFTYSFKIKEKHNLCYIVCNAPRKDEAGCSVNFTLHVAMLETTTHTVTVSTHSSTVSTKVSVASDQFSMTTSAPTFISATNITPCVSIMTAEFDKTEEEKPFVRNKPASFPRAVIISIAVVIFSAVSLVVCFFIFFLRLKSTSRSKNKFKTVNLSADDNCQASPVYATVNKPSERYTKEEHDSMEQELSTYNSELYSELDGAREKESTASPSFARGAETSVTIGFMSEANPSNAKPEWREYRNEGAYTLYAEVSKEEKQAVETASTFSAQTPCCESGATNVQTYQELSKAMSSNDQDVGNFSNSEVVYAVIDKKKKNEAK